MLSNLTYFACGRACGIVYCSCEFQKVGKVMILGTIFWWEGIVSN